MVGRYAALREEACERMPAERDDDARIQKLDLCIEERRAGRDLFRSGFSVFRRPAFHDIRDEDVVAAHGHGGQQLFEELAGPADERPSLLVLVEPGALSDEQNCRGGRPFTRYRIGASPGQDAARAAVDVGGDRREGTPVGIIRRPRPWS